jgi:hypothetical protein
MITPNLVAVPTAGFMLDVANQTIKAYGAKFVDTIITGALATGGALTGTNIKIENSKIVVITGSSFNLS